MELPAALAAGFTLGLASGGHCFWVCASVMGPYLVSTEPELASSPRWSRVAASLRLLCWYNLGRLLAYLAVGAAVSLWTTRQIAPPLHAAALLLTALLLALAVLRPPGSGHHRFCIAGKKRRAGGAILIGALQGLIPCPPFIAAVGLALTSSSKAAGIGLFATLFLGTALFTLPLALLEPLRRNRWLFIASRLLGGAVCLYLLARAVLLLRG